MRFRHLGLATAASTLLLFTKGAGAQPLVNRPITGGPNALFQDGFALQQFEPAPSGDRFFGVPDAHVGGELQLYVTALGNYAYRPLKIRDVTPGNEHDIGFITNHQLYVNVDASLAINNRLLLNVDVPFAIAQSGDNTLLASQPTGGKLGDVRAGLRFNLVGSYKDPIAVGIQGDVWFPTGDQANLTSDNKFRVNPKLVISGILGESFIYTVNGGFLFRRFLDFGSPEIGDAVTFGAAIGYTTPNRVFQIGPEIYGNTVVGAANNTVDSNRSGNTPFLGTHSSPVELLGGAKVRFGSNSDIVLGAAAGPGLTKTPGVAEVRGILSLGLIPQMVEAPKDRDGDGVPDNVDACPDTPGVPTNDPKTNGCPPPPPQDRDGDGIPDTQDACPDTPGLPSPDPLKNGCPADRDGDGIPDNIDACPDVPGVKSDDPKKNGCPPDRDGDGIPDNVDACPDVPGVKDTDPKKNGCPPAAQIVGKEIKIAEQVHFAFNKATILPDSDTILQAVASILKDHPEIKLLSVEGHTDNKGAKGYNQKLSKDRAAAVVKWLSSKGDIEAKRLTSKGFGDANPIASNDTEEGRAQNRRVELHIVKSADDTSSTGTGDAATKGGAGVKGGAGTKGEGGGGAKPKTPNP